MQRAWNIQNLISYNESSKQRNENNPNFNVVGVRNKLLEDIVKARSHLMYLRDNVDEIEFPEGRFEQMNKVGLRFDKLERKLFRI